MSETALIVPFDERFGERERFLSRFGHLQLAVCFSRCGSTGPAVCAGVLPAGSPLPRMRLQRTGVLIIDMLRSRVSLPRAADKLCLWSPPARGPAQLNLAELLPLQPLADCAHVDFQALSNLFARQRQERVHPTSVEFGSSIRSVPEPGSPNVVEYVDGSSTVPNPAHLSGSNNVSAQLLRSSKRR
jgi:hypothetical protein